MNTKLLFEKAKAAGINEIEVYSVKTTNSEIGVFNHNVENLNSSTTFVSHVRGAYNGHLGSVYLENNKLELTTEQLLKAFELYKNSRINN